MAPDSNVQVNASSILDVSESGSRDKQGPITRHQRFPKISSCLYLQFQLENFFFSFQKNPFLCEQKPQKKKKPTHKRISAFKLYLY